MGIDLIKAANDKIALNAIKYPVEKSKGSNAKYTAYAEERDKKLTPEYKK